MACVHMSDFSHLLKKSPPTIIPRLTTGQQKGQRPSQSHVVSNRYPGRSDKFTMVTVSERKNAVTTEKSYPQLTITSGLSASVVLVNCIFFFPVRLEKVPVGWVTCEGRDLNTKGNWSTTDPSASEGSTYDADHADVILTSGKGIDRGLGTSCDPMGTPRQNVCACVTF